MNPTTENISKLLFYEWDPIGIKDLIDPSRYEKNSGEYSRYAREIHEKFSRAVDAKEISLYLKFVCQKKMGMGLETTDWSETDMVAKKIANLLEQASE